MTKLIIWDFDATLGFNPMMWSSTLQKVFKDKLDFECPLEKIRPAMKEGYPWHHPEIPHPDSKGNDYWELFYRSFEKFYTELGLKREDFDLLNHGFRAEYTDIKNWNIYPDVYSTLEESVSRGYKNVILSNHIPELSDIVKQKGIDKYFDDIFISANIGYEKPHPKCLELIFSNYRYAKKDVWIVGDSIKADVGLAVENGLNAVLVRNSSEKYTNQCENLKDVFDYIN